MKEMMKNTVILLAITVVAGFVLGLVYQVTKEPIARQQQKAKTEAYAEVFPGASTFEQSEEMKELKDFPQQIIEEEVIAKDAAGNSLGYVITVTSKDGYAGNITFTVGISNDGTVNGISFLSIAETPGLGMEAEDVLKPQFAGKKVEVFEYTKSESMAENQIDAISGATITTRAITEGVNAGMAYFKLVTEGGRANE